MYSLLMLTYVLGQAAPQTFTLYDPNQEDKRVADVIVEARYVPVPVVLEPRETVNSKSFTLVPRPRDEL